MTGGIGSPHLNFNFNFNLNTIYQYPPSGKTISLRGFHKIWMNVSPGASPLRSASRDRPCIFAVPKAGAEEHDPFRLDLHYVLSGHKQKGSKFARYANGILCVVQFVIFISWLHRYHPPIHHRPIDPMAHLSGEGREEKVGGKGDRITHFEYRNRFGKAALMV